MNEVVVVLCRVFPLFDLPKEKENRKQNQPQQMPWNLRQPGLNIIQVTGQIWQSDEGWNYVLSLTSPLGTMRGEIICLNPILLLLIFLKFLYFTPLNSRNHTSKLLQQQKKSGQAYLGEVAFLHFSVSVVTNWPTYCKSDSIAVSLSYFQLLQSPSFAQ